MDYLPHIYQTERRNLYCSHGDPTNPLCDVIQLPLPGRPGQLVPLPPRVVALVSQPARPRHPGLQLPQVTPALVILEPRVDHSLVHGITLSLFNLEVIGYILIPLKIVQPYLE